MDELEELKAAIMASPNNVRWNPGTRAKSRSWHIGAVYVWPAQGQYVVNDRAKNKFVYCDDPFTAVASAESIALGG